MIPSFAKLKLLVFLLWLAQDVLGQPGYYVIGGTNCPGSQRVS